MGNCGCTFRPFKDGRSEGGARQLQVPIEDPDDELVALSLSMQRSPRCERAGDLPLDDDGDQRDRVLAALGLSRKNEADDGHDSGQSTRTPQDGRQRVDSEPEWPEDSDYIESDEDWPEPPTYERGPADEEDEDAAELTPENLTRLTNKSVMSRSDTVMSGRLDLPTPDGKHFAPQWRDCDRDSWDPPKRVKLVLVTSRKGGWDRVTRTPIGPTNKSWLEGEDTLRVPGGPGDSDGE